MPTHKKSPLNNFIQYSSMAFQMGIIVFGSAIGGVKLDEYLINNQYVETDFPIFTVTFTILGVVFSMYLFIRDLLKK